MKAVLRQSKGKLVGRRVDWLIHQLTGDVINRYDYMQFRKENGFVTNKKGQSLMLSALTQAQKMSKLKCPAACIRRRTCFCAVIEAITFGVCNIQSLHGMGSV
jgi:hypothetical protein